MPTHGGHAHPVKRGRRALATAACSPHWAGWEQSSATGQAPAALEQHRHPQAPAGETRHSLSPKANVVTVSQPRLREPCCPTLVCDDSDPAGWPGSEAHSGQSSPELSLLSSCSWPALGSDALPTAWGFLGPSGGHGGPSGSPCSAPHLRQGRELREPRPSCTQQPGLPSRAVPLQGGRMTQ